MSSFVGFAPVNNPELVMTVVLDDPHPRYYGGTVAAPVFKEVIEAALLYQGYVPENIKVLEPLGASPNVPSVKLEKQTKEVPQENRPRLLPSRPSGTKI